MSPIAVVSGFVLGPTLWAYNVYWLLWQCLTGWGVLYLARWLGSSAWLGLVCALAWVFSGVLMTDAQHMPYLIGFYSLPWVIWRLDVGLREGRYMACAEAGALWGLSALSGYPGIVIMNGCFAGLWVLGRVLSGGVSNRGGAWVRGVLSLVIVAGVGVVVLSPTYLSFLYEMKGYSVRAGALERDVAVGSGAMHPGVLTCFSSPYLPIMKGFNDANLWVYTDVSGCGLYVSALVIAFAGASVWGMPRDRFRWWLVGLGLLALGLCLGQVLPLRGWLYDVFLPARYFRLAVNFRVYAIFVLIVLGILGCVQWSGRREDLNGLFKRLMVINAVAGACAVTAFFVMVWWVKRHGDYLPWAVTHLLVVWVGGVLFWLVLLKTRLAERPWLAGICVVGFVLVDVAGARFLPNMIVQTTKPQTMEVWRRLDAKHVSSLELTEHGLDRVVMARIPEPPNCKNLMIKMPSLSGYTAITNPYVSGIVENAKVAEMFVGPQRVWFCRNPVEVDANQQEFDAFMSRAEELGALPGVIHTRAGMLEGTKRFGIAGAGGANPTVKGREAPASERVPVIVDKYGTDELSMRVLCPEDGWLIVTDRWSRSWCVWVNGVPAEVSGGAFAFRAVKVRGGENSVVMRFEPMGMPWLLLLSWSTLALVGGVSVWLSVRAGKRESSAVGDVAAV